MAPTLAQLKAMPPEEMLRQVSAAISKLKPSQRRRVAVDLRAVPEPVTAGKGAR